MLSEGIGDFLLGMATLHVELPQEVGDLTPCALAHHGFSETLAAGGHVCILQVCKMLSTPQVHDRPLRKPQQWPWSARARLHSLTGVQESDSAAQEDFRFWLGVVLREARKAAKVKQKAAAAAIGMNPASFTRWEAGGTGISAYDLARLVAVYGLDVDAMLVLDPPHSKAEIKRRLQPVAQAAQRGIRRGLLRPLDDEPEGPEDVAELE